MTHFTGFSEQKCLFLKNQKFSKPHLKGHAVVRALPNLWEESGEGIKVIDTTGGIDGLRIDH